MDAANNDKEMLTMAEEELYRLHRQLRIMEEDKIAFLEEIGKKLDKQRKIIKVLKKEKEDLSEDITIVTCINQTRADKKIYETICQLVEEHIKHGKTIRKIKEDIKELEIQIRKLEHDIKALRPKTSIPDRHYENRLTSGQRSVKVLQNRLDYAVKHFCFLLTKNRELRSNIDHLLKEREHFNTIWNNLLKDISNGKKIMVDIIEQATLAFDQREEWGLKIIALKKKAQNDFLAHSEEMREIQRKLDHDLTLREFLSVKGQKRILKDLEEKERKKKESQAEALENQLRIYQETMEKIQKFCNEEDVQRIASQFLKQEEENFALFNYVNELNHEIEILNSSIKEIQEKIEEQEQENLLRSKKRQATIKNLKDDLEESEKMLQNDEDNLSKTSLDIETILDGIVKLYNMLVHDKAPILELLSGKDSKVNLYNIKIYLGTIEKKIAIIISESYFSDRLVSIV